MNGDSSVQNAASGRASTACGRRRRGCRPGRGPGRRRRSDPRAHRRRARRTAAGETRSSRRRGRAGGANALARSATRPKSCVVTVALVGDQGPQRVVEVVGPGGVAVPAAALARAHHHRVVEAGLGDHVGARVDRVHAAGDRGDDVLGAGVEDRVDRVEAQPVDAEVAHPALGALAHPLAHRVAVGVVVVDRLAPRRLVLGGEVRAEGLHRLGARGAEMVVDDVEDHRQPRAWAAATSSANAVGPAVGRLRGRDVDAVVAPAAGARETRPPA